MPLVEYFNTIAARTVGKNLSATLIVEEQFKRVATYVINNLYRDEVLNEFNQPQELENLFANFVIKSLEAKQESLKESMTSISGIGRTQELQEELTQIEEQCLLINQQLDRIKNYYKDDAVKLAALKKFLKTILSDEQNKQLILEQLWKEYLNAQKNHLWVKSWINAIDQELLEDGCFRAQFGQAQANELERSGMVLFAMGFTFVNRSWYTLSGGTRKLDQDSDSSFNCQQSNKRQSENSNAFNERQKILTGSPFINP